MRILVVGGAGFIGAHVVRRCLAEGHDLHVLQRPESDVTRLADMLPAIDLHRLALADGAAVRACLTKVRPTHIVYLANDTRSRHETGLAGAVTSVGQITDLVGLLDAAAGLVQPPCSFLRAGSMAEYGAGPVPFREEQREQPETHYAAAITAGTHYAMAMAPHLPFPVITARLALVYGFGQADDFLVPALIRACLERREFVVERPRDRRDLLHVTTVVEALRRLMEIERPGGTIVNVGSGEAVGVGTLARHIAVLSGVEPTMIRLRPQTDPVTLQLCTERMTAMTGWTADIDWKTGVAMLIEKARQARITVSS